MAKLTTNALRTKWNGKKGGIWRTDGGPRGGGRLVARTTGHTDLAGRAVTDGVLFYFQYFIAGGGKRFLALGPYDAEGRKDHLSLRQARDRAAELSALFRSGVTDLHAHFERERAAAERALKAEQEAARRAVEESQRGTLKQLLDAYVEHLVKQQKQSAGDVRNLFDNHVLNVEAERGIGSRKAADIPVDDWVRVISHVTEAGKGRTAAKLRSYARSAYALALAARSDPTVPLVFRTFGITSNPLASVPSRSFSKFNRTRKRNLTADELGTFLRRLDALPGGVQKDALEVDLRVGGQRPAQLLRARASNVDLSRGIITLYDAKGARTEAREHPVFLTKDASAIVKRRLEALAGAEDPNPPLFSSDEGRTALNSATISNLVTEISSAMVKAKEAREPFQLRDIRRTCETMLGDGLRVSSDVRAHLQSHGLGGVQKRHYDMGTYGLQIRQALEKWGRHLAKLKTGEKADVVSLKRARARRE